MKDLALGFFCVLKKYAQNLKCLSVNKSGSVLVSVYGTLLSGCEGQRKGCQTVGSIIKNWIKRMQGEAKSGQELESSTAQSVLALVLQFFHVQKSQSPVWVAGHKSGVCLLLRNSAGWQRPFLQLSVA